MVKKKILCGFFLRRVNYKLENVLNQLINSIFIILWSVRVQCLRCIFVNCIWFYLNYICFIENVMIFLLNCYVFSGIYGNEINIDIVYIFIIIFW